MRLRSAGPDATVTGIATFCGFPELGRFSVRYHQLYGQPPSQTLRQQLQPVVAPFNRPAVAPPLNRKTTP